MSITSVRVIIRAGLLSMAVAGLAQVADATTIYGGGSSLIASAHRLAANCHGADVGSVNFGRCLPPYVSPSSDTLEYAKVGSGAGIAALYSHDALKYGDIDPVTPGVQLWNTVQYGFSEIPLQATDVMIYNSGGGTIQGVTISSTPTAGQYPIPFVPYGRLVQFPVALTGIALAYDPIYKKVNNAGVVTSYAFKIDPAFARANGGLRLDADTYCKILNGQITNWNDPAITFQNNNTSLKDPTDPAPFSVPIELVGRGESSGATQVVTRHLAAACAGVSGNVYTNVAGSSTLPIAVQGPAVGGSPVTGKFTLATGSDGAAAYASFTATPSTGGTITQGRLAYVDNNRVLPYAANNGLPYTLHTASLKNAAGSYREPSAANATAAFAGNRPPETAVGSSGAYDPSQTAWGQRFNPADWVRVSVNPGVVAGLANPSPSTAYPIVGTVNFIGYTCYATAGRANALRTPSGGSVPGYMNYYFNEPRVDDASGILATAGFAPLPEVWQTAIRDTFLAPTSATFPLGLFIDLVGPTATNPNCVPRPGA